MPCINPGNIASISGLIRNQFAYPCLAWNTILQPINAVQVGTLQDMFKILWNKGFHADLIKLTGVNNAVLLTNNSFGIIEKKITTLINKYFIARNRGISRDSIIKTIVLGIHLWGGKTGRNLFVMNGGFNINFNYTLYENMICHLENNNLNNAIDSILSIPEIGVSFATKHLSFWSKSNEINFQVPVFDSQIALMLYGKTGNLTKKSFLQYAQIDLPSAVNEIFKNNPILVGNYDIIKLERDIFNFSNTNLGQQWMNLRK